MKRIFGVVLLSLFLTTIAVAEKISTDYETILTGTWSTMQSEWSRAQNSPASISVPSDNIFVTCSGNGTVYMHIYQMNEANEIDRSQQPQTYEVTFAPTGTVIALLDSNYFTTIYEKTEVGSVVGGTWYADYYMADYKKVYYGQENLHRINLSFMSNGNVIITTFSRNSRSDGEAGFNTEEFNATWSQDGSIISLFTDIDGFEEVQGFFKDSYIDFSESIEALVFFRN